MFQSRPSGISIYYRQNKYSGVLLQKSFNPVQAGFLFITSFDNMFYRGSPQKVGFNPVQAGFLFITTGVIITLIIPEPKRACFNPVQAGFLFITQPHPL